MSDSNSPYDPPKSELNDLKKASVDNEQEPGFSFPLTKNKFPSTLITLLLVAIMAYLLSN